MALSHSDRDLARIAAAAQHRDQTLGTLAAISEDTSSGYMVGLLVNGMTLYGRIESPREFYALLDVENATIVERGRAVNADSWPDDVAAKLEGTWARHFDEDLAKHRTLVERNADGDFEDMSEEDMRSSIADDPTTLTLAEVYIYPPGDTLFQVPLMRVNRSHVAAWWPVPRDAAGSARFAHPSVVPPPSASTG